TLAASSRVAVTRACWACFNVPTSALNSGETVDLISRRMIFQVNTDRGSYGKSNYLAVVGTDWDGDGPITGTTTPTYKGAFYGNSRNSLRDFTDGASNTLLAGERTTEGAANGGIWLGARGTRSDNGLRTSANGNFLINNAGATDGAASSAHVGGCHFLFGDGRVSFLSENISSQTYEYLGLINDGNVIGEY
ncbi:MAG: DUF1559 domain-containing protein, partial [Planctomycetaceae bacterium]|nr:DUF1559 domain-containing protein [Planctomycetaceae bacterium]